MDEKAHYLEHRQRLRERLLAGGADAIPDYELLELVLFGAIPRKDMKPLAKRLIERFGGFANAISADPAEIASVEGAGPSVAAALKTVQAAALRLMREEAMERPAIGSWDKLLAYCRARHWDTDIPSDWRFDPVNDEETPRPRMAVA